MILYHHTNDDTKLLQRYKSSTKTKTFYPLKLICIDYFSRTIFWDKSSYLLGYVDSVSLCSNSWHHLCYCSTILLGTIVLLMSIHSKVRFHSPVFQFIISFQTYGGEYIAPFSYGPKYQIHLHCLSYIIAMLRSPVYHEPLITSKRGWVNRSIEGDSSVRVGSSN